MKSLLNLIYRFPVNTGHLAVLPAELVENEDGFGLFFFPCEGSFEVAMTVDTHKGTKRMTRTISTTKGLVMGDPNNMFTNLWWERFLADTFNLKEVHNGLILETKGDGEFRTRVSVRREKNNGQTDSRDHDSRIANDV